jgi:hypothetical protein
VTAHRPLLDAIADELVAMETVSAARLAEIVAAHDGTATPAAPVAAVTG